MVRSLQDLAECGSEMLKKSLSERCNVIDKR